MRTMTAIVLTCASATASCGGAGDGGEATEGSSAGTGAAATPTDPGESSGTGPGAGAGECHVLADGWTVDIVPVDENPRGMRLVIAAGEPAVAWVADGEFADRMMYSSRAGAAWTHEKLRSSTGNLGVPGLTHDPAGAPHLLYGFDDALGGAVELAIRQDGAWTEVPLGSDRASETCSLVTAPDGGVHGLFHQSYQLDEALADGMGGWTQQLVDDGKVGDTGMATSGIGNDLRVDAAGTLHASYVDAAGSVYYNRKDADVWQRRLVAPAGADLRSTAIALDGDGGAHVVYRREADEALMLATPAGDAWTEQALEVGSDGALAAQLEIDGAGVRHVAHARSTADIRYANDAGGGFEFVAVAGEVEYGTLALALGADDGVWLAWAVDAHLCVARRD